MQAAMESCPAKTVIAGTMGFGLGGMFGLFMSSVRISFGLEASPATLREQVTEIEQLTDILLTDAI